MKRLLLLGGGHAHVYVLDRLAAERLQGVEVVLVSPFGRQIYSGMLPGWIAGIYPIAACTLPLDALAARAGVRFVQQAGVALDAAARELVCANGTRLRYDWLSIDIGPATARSAIAGAAEHAIAVRPIERFIDGVEGVLADARMGRPGDLVIVGGGAAGVELGFALDARLRALGLGGDRQVGVTVIGAAARPLDGMPSLLRLRVERLMRRRGIGWVGGHRVTAVDSDGVVLESGRRLAARHVLLVTGAAAQGWLAASGLATDTTGFVRVGPCLQSVSHPEVFAAGDCAAYADARPKSGVFAVRAGPALAENLSRAVAGKPLRSWRPQRRALYLISTGTGHALGAWGPIAWWGDWVWRWKDRIDRAFIARFTPDSAPPAGEPARPR